MALAGGKCNSGISMVERGGRKFVERIYETKWWPAQEQEFRLDLKRLASVGLVPEHELWTFEARPDQIVVANPWVEIVPLADLDEAVRYRVYEELLAKVMLLHSSHGAFITDAHSQNLVAARKAGGEVMMVVIDGKAAGVGTSLPNAYARLNVKLRHERVAEHRWFLHEYLKFLEKLGSSEADAPIS